MTIEWIRTLISALTGSILTLAGAALLDRRRRILRYKALLKTVYTELIRNRDRIIKIKKDLPSEIRAKLEVGDSWPLRLTEEEMRSLAWSFPKPYGVQAWNAFVSSGLISLLPEKLLECLTELYDGLFSANHLSNLSASFFQVLAGPTRLDADTQKNMDLFLRTGARLSAIPYLERLDLCLSLITEERQRRKWWKI